MRGRQMSRVIAGRDHNQMGGATKKGIKIGKRKRVTMTEAERSVNVGGAVPKKGGVVLERGDTMEEGIFP